MQKSVLSAGSKSCAIEFIVSNCRGTFWVNIYLYLYVWSAPTPHTHTHSYKCAHVWRRQLAAFPTPFPLFSPPSHYALVAFSLPTDNARVNSTSTYTHTPITAHLHPPAAATTPYICTYIHICMWMLRALCRLWQLERLHLAQHFAAHTHTQTTLRFPSCLIMFCWP